MMTISPQPLFFRATAAAVLLLVGACAPARPSAGPAPAADSAAAPIAERRQAPVWTPQSSAGEIARWVRRDCGGIFDRKQPCIERTLVGLIDQAGIARAMEVLDTLAATDGDVRRNAHALAHGLGIAAYRSPETLAATFAACPPTQMSGCYHGVVQGYFLSLARQGKAPGTAELDALCEPHRASPFLFFQCVHGMGHGLMAVHGNHVPRSLEACDLASDSYVRENCYGGVFMENIVRVTHPHHTAEGHAGTQGGHAHHGAADTAAGHDAHAAHAAAGPAQAETAGQDTAHVHHADAEHGAHAPGQQAQAAHAHHDSARAASGDTAHAGHAHAPRADSARAGPSASGGTRVAEWKPLDRRDPLYPCNVVAEKYQEACYTLQSSAVLYFNAGDVRATAQACQKAPERFVATCFLSLGRDVTALAAQGHQRSVELCGRAAGLAGGRGDLWCMMGVVHNLVNLAADPGEGMRFCRVVTAAEHKRHCYRIVGESIATLVTGTARRRASCEAAEPAYRITCRRGAGVEPSGTEG